MPKVIIVGFIVAVSQLTGVATSSYLSINNHHDFLALYANIEAILAFVTSILFFGHQHSLNRNLVNCNSGYKKTQFIKNTQSVIFNLSIIIAGLFFVLSILNNETFYIWVALTTIFIGISPDFALYGLSKPIHASLISLLKTGFPNLILICLVLLHFNNINLLYFGILFSYILASIAVISFTQVGLKINGYGLYKLKEYLIGYKLGIPSLLLTGIRALPVIVSTTLFHPSEIVYLILFYKYFMLGVGVKRLFVQTYYSMVANKLTALKLDLICLILASVFIIPLYIFNNELALLIGFGKNVVIYNISLLLIYFNFIGVSNGTRIILLNKDILYFLIHLVAVILLVIGISAGIFANKVIIIFYAGISAEIALLFGSLVCRSYYEMHT